MDVYTGRGDAGETDLADQRRVSKASPRIEAYGTVDELNALLGTALPVGEADVDERLHAVQNHLHVLSADLAAPEGDGPEITADHVATVEGWIDDCEADLAPLEAFVLPGGSDAGATLHHARAVCRRAERRVVALAEAAAVSESVLAYVNRLSDALFVFARLVNQRAGVAEDNPTY